MDLQNFECAALTVNLQVANLVADKSGDATNYGLLRAVLEQNQDGTLSSALDPRRCETQVSKIGDKLGVNIQYRERQCEPLENICEEFNCEPAENTEGSFKDDVFTIDECIGFKLGIPFRDWDGACCGEREQLNTIVRAASDGSVTAQALNQMIAELSQDIYDRKDYTYETWNAAEKINRTLNAPVVGKLAVMNQTIQDKILAAAGYNFVKLDDGTIVGNNVWELPVLYGTSDCADSRKAIDATALALQLRKFIGYHPECGAGATIIGGRRFADFLYMADAACCDANGVNHAAAIRKVLGIMGRFYEDDTLGQDEFIILENNVVALFWYNEYSKFSRYSSSRPSDLDGVGGIHRRTGITQIPVRNCRGTGMNFAFDTFALLDLKTCLDEPTYTLSFKAQWDLFTHPALGCDNPRTGIYRGTLTDICVTV